MHKAEILDRIIAYYGLKNKTRLAEFLGVSAQTVSNWYSRNSIDYDLVFEKCAGVDFNWLVCGSSYGYPKAGCGGHVASDNMASYEVPVLSNKIIPVAGVLGGDSVAQTASGVVAETITVPERMLDAGEYVAFRVADEAMKPSFRQGDYVICKRVVDCDWRRLDPLKPYAIAVADMKTVFRRPSEIKKDKKIIVLSADNSDKVRFPDIEMEAGRITGLWEVKLNITSPDAYDTETLFRRLRELENDMEALKRTIHNGSGN